MVVTRFGLGTAPLAGLFEAVEEDQALQVIEHAWDAGIRFFDTAPLYGHGLAELAKNPINLRWQAEMAPMMAVATDFSGKNSDRMPMIFEL